jgi:hypothetical protein
MCNECVGGTVDIDVAELDVVGGRRSWTVFNVKKDVGSGGRPGAVAIVTAC